MKTKKGKRASRTQSLEVELIRAVSEKNRPKVAILLDRLHREGVHQGFAVEAAKNFRSSEYRKGRR